MRHKMRHTPKQQAVIAAWKRDTTRSVADVAREVGANISYSAEIIRDALEEQNREAGRKRMALVEANCPAPTNGKLARITDLEPRRNYWAVQFSESQAQDQDRKALQGPGLTGFWEDGKLVGLFDGLVATVGGLLKLMAQSRSQVEWNSHAHEAVLFAAVCESYVAPVAKRGRYRGMRGDEYFGQLSKYIRERIALGPLG